MSDNPTWTEPRATRLFARYNGKYFDGSLESYAIRKASLRDRNGCPVLGEIDYVERTIYLDFEVHPTDSDIRATLLHEMCHVAAGQESEGRHGSAFLAHLERLLERRAPIVLLANELEGAPTADVVPARFPLCRARYAKALVRAWDADLFAAFQEQGARALSWHEAIRLLGPRYGLVDLDLAQLRTERRRLRVARAGHQTGWMSQPPMFPVVLI